MEEMAQQEFVNLSCLTCPQARDIGELRERHPTACFESNFRQKNRYPDVLAIEETRVKLGSWDCANGTDYINANFIDVETLGGSGSQTRFISTQAPLPSTFGDFWQMVWEQVRISIYLD
jgi:protein tyrosine phosphatase